MFSDIDYFLHDLSKGIARIQQGDVPDGSGNPIGSGGTLTDYWFKPGISDPFIAYMSSAAGGGGLISSTSDQDKGFINLGNAEYIDEDGKLTGFGVTAPAATVHIQPGISGTTTLVPSADVALHGNPAVRWDGYRNAAGTLLGPPVYLGCNTSDDDTSWSGTNDSTGPGVNTQGFTMSGTIIPGRVWTCKVRLRTDSGTCSASGNLEFRVNDSLGNQYSGTGVGTGGTFAVDFTGLSTTWTTYTFTIDGAGSTSATGQPANSIEIGVAGVQLAATHLYIRCTYIELSAGGDADILRWNNSSATLLGKINSSGYLGVGTGTATLGAMETIISDAAATLGLIIKGATSQSGDLTEWQNSSGTPLSLVTSDGYFSSRRLLLNGSTSGTVTITGGTTPTSHTYVVPTAQGAASTLLQNDGSGNLSWATNASVVDSARTWSTLQKFKDTTFLVGDDGDITKATIFSLGGATTGKTLTLLSSHTDNRTVTLPDETGTIPTKENTETITGSWTFDGTGGGPNPLDIVMTGSATLDGGGLRFLDTSGFKVQIDTGGGLTTDRIIVIPDANGTFMTTSAIQTVTGKTLATNKLRMSNSTSNVIFQDSATTSKQLFYSMTGLTASTDSTMAFVASAARTWTHPNDTGTIDMIVAPTSATVDKTGQTASIGATTAYTTVHAGFYRVSAYWVFTAVTLAGSLTVTALWTDPQQAQTSAFINAVAFAAAGSFAQGSTVFYATTGTTIQFSTTLVNTGTYNVYVRVESLT